MPLKIIVIGAGIGGLTAAIALRRQGHDVELYETAASPNEAGAAINTVPNATSVLKKLGVEVRESGAVPLETMRLLKSNGELLEDRNMLLGAGRWQAPWLMTHRAHLHDHLKSIALAKDGGGKPAALHYARKASSVNPETATVYFEDGSTVRGDVLVGADGVHSVTRAAISPSTKAQRGENSAFRFLVTRKAALEDPRTSDFFSRIDSMDMFYGSDRKIVIYPCSNNTVFNFVCIHPAGLSEASSGYNTKASKSLLLDIFSGFDPVVLAMLDKADSESLRVYPLFDMENLPTFVSGRLALIGDAAHPFLPHLAQGGAMAIEDGVSLGVMLSGSPSTDELESRIRLYNDARYDRASLVQRYTRKVGGDGIKEEESTTEKLSLNDYLEYGLSHDEFDASQAILHRWQWSRDSNLCWQQPISFGPTPKHDQDVSGPVKHPVTGPSGTRTATIVFKTSATQLRNLFPTTAYSFDARDTVAYASFRLHTFSNAESAGECVSHALGFYIHNARYTMKKGDVVTGTYLPVMFESSLGLATTKREELGLPTVFSNISVESQSDFIAATLSREGQTWAKLDWSNLALSEDVGNGEALDEKILVHNYIAGAERSLNTAPGYAAIASFADKPETGRSGRRDGPLSAVSIAFDALDEQRLPTLHHVISRLAELPIFEVIRSFVDEGAGLPDFRAVVSIEPS